MSLNTPPNRLLQSDRIVSTVTTTQDRQPELWEDSQHDFDGFARLLNALEKTTTDEAVNICLLAECIADHFARGYTTLEGETTTIDLARGHSDLNQLLSPTTLERAEALMSSNPRQYTMVDQGSSSQNCSTNPMGLGPDGEEAP